VIALIACGVTGFPTCTAACACYNRIQPAGFMPANHFYYYDHETCAFVEVPQNRRRYYLKVGGMVVGLALVLALGLSALMGNLFETPEELALKAENEALQRQLAQAGDQIEHFSTQLDKLAETDQQLYRTLLQAEPIPQDVRKVGLGGTDKYAEFNRFNAPVAALLRTTAAQIDQIALKINLQNKSYRELTQLAVTYRERMGQMPAILPADGNIVSGFGMRLHPILRVYRMHAGVDIHLSVGSPVVATADGVVLEAGSGSGYGNFVKLSHAATGYTTLYGHLSRVPRHIHAGVAVKRGDVIAYSGNTGLSTAPHLHYEVRDAQDQPLNPIHFLAPSMTPQAFRKLQEASDRSTVAFD
jgi:murein DD-endopeptidase MepM/ murein hydrolase activator NlpD